MLRMAGFAITGLSLDSLLFRPRERLVDRGEDPAVDQRAVRHNLDLDADGHQPLHALDPAALAVTRRPKHRRLVRYGVHGWTRKIAWPGAQIVPMYFEPWSCPFFNCAIVRRLWVCGSTRAV